MSISRAPAATASAASRARLSGRPAPKGKPTTQIGKEALADAASSYASGYTTVMLISAALMLLAGIVAVLLLRKADVAAEGPAKTDPATQLVTAAAPAATGDSSADSSSSGQAPTSPSNPSKE